MDSQRLILFFGLVLVLLLIWDAWQREYGTPPAPDEPVVEERAERLDEPRRVERPDDVPDAPAPDTPEALDTPDAPADELPEVAPERPLDTGERIRVRTDLLDVEIDTVGGDLRGAELLAYPVTVDDPDTPVRLMNDTLPEFFVAQSGLLSTDRDAPNHHARYRADQHEYRLDEDAAELRVPLTWESEDGIRVTKTYIFRRDSYVVDVIHEVENRSQAPWQGRQYRQLQRTEVDDTPWFIYTYLGGAIYSDEDKYQKISFSDMESSPLSRNIQGGWAAMLQHYFLAAWIPDAAEHNHYYSRVLDHGRYALGLVSPETAVGPGDRFEFKTQLFVGPKEQDRMQAVAEGLRLTVDYGWLTVISQPLFWLLDLIHGVVGNWGWSIVILTLLIKIVFYKLSETSYRSMAKMRKVHPRLVALRERYKDDKQRLNQEMMQIYKKEKINPLSGCLPILVQIPVFIALYWVLLESVELRQAPFMLWIRDLSIPDPYFVLPLLMGLTMFIQQKLNPAPLDDIQKKVFMALPVVFTVFFAFFPAGLVLYWVANNALSIAQQWLITRRIEALPPNK